MVLHMQSSKQQLVWLLLVQIGLRLVSLTKNTSSVWIKKQSVLVNQYQLFLDQSKLRFNLVCHLLVVRTLCQAPLKNWQYHQPWLLLGWQQQTVVRSFLQNLRLLVKISTTSQVKLWPKRLILISSSLTLLSLKLSKLITKWQLHQLSNMVVSLKLLHLQRLGTISGRL